MSAVVEACGACHSAAETDTVHVATTPEGSGDLSTMTNHRWAAERLLQGVIGPSDEAWNEGAAVLGRADVFDLAPDDTTVAGQSLLEREAALRQMGNVAARTTGARPRAAVYGQVLATCAACHGAANVTIPQGEE